MRKWTWLVLHGNWSSLGLLIGYFQAEAWNCVAGTILCEGLTWAEGTESVWFLLFRCASEQAQYFVTVGPGRKELQASGFLGAQVNMARFAWYLEFAGAFDWLLSGWGVELRGRHRLRRGIAWQAQYCVTVWPDWKCLVLLVMCSASVCASARYVNIPHPPHPPNPPHPWIQVMCSASVCASARYVIIPPHPTHPTHPTHEYKWCVRLVCVQVQGTWSSHPSPPQIDPKGCVCF